MSAEVLRNPRLFFPTPHPSKAFVCLGMTQLIATRCWGLASNMAMGHRRLSPGHERGRRGQEVDRSFPATPCVWLHLLPLSTWRSGQPWFFLPSSLKFTSSYCLATSATHLASVIAEGLGSHRNHPVLLTKSWKWRENIQQASLQGEERTWAWPVTACARSGRGRGGELCAWAGPGRCAECAGGAYGCVVGATAGL